MADNTTKVLEVVVDNNKAITSISEYNRLIDAQKQKQRDLAEAFKSGAISEADYYKAIAKSKEEVKAYSRSMQELSKEVQNNIKDAQEQEGSLRGLRAQLSNLTKEFDALSRAERNGEAGRAKMAEINRITDELKQAEEETQRFYRNVGNYPDVKPLEEQLGAIKKQLAMLKYEGKDNTEEFAQLAEQAANMKDALADVEQQITSTASDTKNLDTTIMGLTTVMGGLSLFGPMFADGSEEAEKFNKTLQKMQAVMMVLNTLKTIQNNTQKQGLIYQTAENARLKAVTVLKGIEAKMTARQTKATISHTLAQKALNLVMKANPVYLLVGGFAALAGTVALVSKAIGGTTKNVKEQEKAIKSAQKALEKHTELYEASIKLMEKTGASEARIMTSRLSMLSALAEEARVIGERIAATEDSKLWGDADKVQEAADAYKERVEDLRKALEEATIAAKAWGSENKKYYEQLGLNEYEKALDNINRELEDQKTLVKTLYVNQKITREEAAEAILHLERKANEDRRKLAADDAARQEALLNEKLKKELDIMRQVTDAQLELIMDENEKAMAVETERHKRAVADLKARLTDETNLTETQRAAINKLIEIEELKHKNALANLDRQTLETSLKTREESIKLQLDAVKKGSKDEYDLKVSQLEAQRDLELNNAKLTEEQKALIRAKYAAQENELRKEYNNKVLQESQDLVAKEWENRINEAANKGQQTLQMEIDAAKARMDALQQLEGESDADFKARQLEAEREYIDAKKALNDYELEIEQAKYDALSGMVGGLSSIMEAFGEENEALAKAGKILALAEIAINTGKALAAGIAQASAAGPWPANIAAIGTTVATVLANIATAISTVKSAKFASGGLVAGPGSGTSDSIPARLSNGESVMNAKTTSMFGPLLSSLNQAGGGIAFNPGLSGQREGYEFLASAVADGMKRANLHVAIDEVTRVQDRVAYIKEISTIK
jgi:hypothetical protein